MKVKNISMIILILICVISCTNKTDKIPIAKNGILDLRDWDFEKNGLVKLDGEWEFLWKQFLNSSDFNTIANKNYIKVPGTWRGHIWNNEKLPYYGYATYKLKILINKKYKDIGIKCSDEKTAFKVFINDSLMGENGTISKTEEGSVPQYKPFEMYFDNITDTINVVFHISNYQHWAAGMYYSHKIGTRNMIIEYSRNKVLYDATMIFGIFILSLILLFFFIFRRKEKSSLIISIFSLVYIFRISCIGEKLMVHLFPNISWYLLYRIEWLSVIIFALVLLLNINYLFKDSVPKSFNLFFLTTIIISGLILLFLPTYISSRFHQPIQFFFIAIIVILLIVAIRILIQKKNNSILFFLSTCFLAIGSINEILYYIYHIPLIIDSHIGVLLFSFTQMLLLARMFSNAYHRIENYAKDLKIEVDEKTRDLREEKEKSDKLLLNVLPEQIATRLKRGETQIADHFEEASVIFIDIADFTKLSARSKPQEMVKMLNDIFTIFDKISAKYGLEKIKTIGDCYMAAAGIPIPRYDHAEAVAMMALEAMKTMRGYRISSIRDRVSETSNSNPETQIIEFRIGLDCGPIVAGVIGEQKFIYDLWGDMVNTASRMETLGVIGEIQCTERFVNKLKIDNGKLKMKFVERGEIEIKGKGMMKTYFLMNNE